MYYLFDVNNPDFYFLDLNINRITGNLKSDYYDTNDHSFSNFDNQNVENETSISNNEKSIIDPIFYLIVIIIIGIVLVSFLIYVYISIYKYAFFSTDFISIMIEFVPFIFFCFIFSIVMIYLIKMYKKATIRYKSYMTQKDIDDNSTLEKLIESVPKLFIYFFLFSLSIIFILKERFNLF